MNRSHVLSRLLCVLVNLWVEPLCDQVVEALVLRSIVLQVHPRFQLVDCEGSLPELKEQVLVSLRQNPQELFEILLPQAGQSLAQNGDNVFDLLRILHLLLILRKRQSLFWNLASLTWISPSPDTLLFDRGCEQLLCIRREPFIEGHICNLNSLPLFGKEHLELVKLAHGR